MKTSILIRTRFATLTLATFAVVMIFISCNQSEKVKKTIDNELLIEVPESQLYVRVRGNTENPLIINLHGGPGGYSGIDIWLIGPYIEEEFLIAYFDQRGCGKSLSCSDTSVLTVEQYIEDLDTVIDSLMNHYNKKNISLMGTSWGGMYGFLYMVEHQQKIQSYACIGGKVNSHYQNHSLIDFELKKAKELLQTNISKVLRKEMEHIINELLRIKNSNFAHFHKDVNWIKHELPPKLGFNAYFADTSKVITLNDVLQDTSLLNLMKYSKDEYLQIGEKAEIVNRAFRNTPSYNNINIEDDLIEIATPTVIIQGNQDYVVGTGHAELIYNALSGLSSEEKELHILSNTGHSPAIENPERLSGILIAFFQKHTNSQKK